MFTLVRKNPFIGIAEQDVNNYNENVDVRYVKDAGKKVVKKLVEGIKIKVNNK